MSELKPEERCSEDQAFDVLMIVAYELVSTMMNANQIDAPTAITEVVELWENFSLHHSLMRYLRPETDDMDGMEYAGHLDDFENDFINRLETQWAEQSSASNQEEA